MGLLDYIKETMRSNIVPKRIQKYLVAKNPHLGKYHIEDVEFLLSSARLSANQINGSESVEDFEKAFADLVSELQKLMWYNEYKNVYINPTPRENLKEILLNMEATINAFIERANRRIILYSYDTADKADKYESLMKEIESSAIISQFLTEKNYEKIAELSDKADKARIEAEQEEKRKKRKEALYSVGSKSGLDLSDIDEMEVISTIENKLSILYSFYLSGKWSPKEAELIFSTFVCACQSSKLPLAAEVRLESLIEEYKPKFSSETTMYAIDHMGGHEFEACCAGLLKRNGFSDVEVTPGSGDQGVDIIAVKDGIKYAIQCKCYSSDLGNKPVQEVHTGAAVYHCQIGAVMTNRHFTPGAKQAAEATGVLLWDRDKLVEMLK